MSEQEVESNNPSASGRKVYVCYRCNREIEPLMAPDPTCPHCNDGFVQEVSDLKLINSDTAMAYNIIYMRAYKFCVSSDFI